MASGKTVDLTMNGFDIVKIDKTPQVLVIDDRNKKLINPKDYPVFKDNKLVQASYRLSLTENRIIHWLISKITPYDEDFKEYTISVREFINVTGVNDQNLYSEMPLILKKLTTKSIVLKDVEGKLGKDAYLTWFSYAEHDKGSGVIRVMFHPVLKPYLLQLKGHFTSFPLEKMINLDSFYAQRFYELLKQEKFRGGGTLSIEDIRWYFGINEGSLMIYDPLKRRVIEPSVKKINDKTDLFVSYEEKKLGRKVNALKLDVRSKITRISIPSNYNSETPENPLFEKITAIGFQRKQTINILKNYGDSIVKAALEVMEGKKDTIETPKAYLKIVLDNLKIQSKVNNSTVKIPSPEELNLTFEGEFKNCLKTLAELTNYAAYKSWFVDTKVQFDIREAKLLIVCPNLFVVDHIESKYKTEILKAWNQNEYKINTVEVSVCE